MKASSKEVGRKIFARLDEIMSKCKDDASVKAVVSKFYNDLHNGKVFIDYLIGNWFDANRIRKYTHNMFMFFTSFFYRFEAFMILMLHFIFQEWG